MVGTTGRTTGGRLIVRQAQQAALVLSAVLGTHRIPRFSLSSRQHSHSQGNSHSLTGLPQATCVANASRDTHHRSSMRSRHGHSRLQQGLVYELELGALAMIKTIAYSCSRTNRLFDNLPLYFLIVPKALFIFLQSARSRFLAGCRENPVSAHRLAYAVQPAHRRSSSPQFRCPSSCRP